MKYRGRLKSVEEFQNTVLRAEDDGSTLRLKDVAEVELGALSYSFHGKTNGHPGVTFMAFQVAGANATSVNECHNGQSEKCRKTCLRVRNFFR